MSFFILLNGKLNQHSFTYLSPEGQRLEPTLVPHQEPYRLPAQAAQAWVIELMTKKVMTLSPESSAAEAIDLFKKKHIHHIPIARDGKLVGLVSDRDVMWLQQIYADKTAKLDRFMNKIVVVCHEETAIDHLAKVFYRP